MAGMFIPLKWLDVPSSYPVYPYQFEGIEIVYVIFTQPRPPAMQLPGTHQASQERRRRPVSILNNEFHQSINLWYDSKAAVRKSRCLLTLRTSFACGDLARSYIAFKPKYMITLRIWIGMWQCTRRNMLDTRRDVQIVILPWVDPSLKSHRLWILM